MIVEMKINLYKPCTLLIWLVPRSSHAEKHFFAIYKL